MYAGSAADLAKLTQFARTALTQAEQTLGRPGYFKLVGPTPTYLGSSTIDDFLAAGGGQWVDMISYHGYYTPGNLEHRVAADIANVKLLMAAYGWGNKPNWNTEGAPGCASEAPTGVDYVNCPWGATPPVEVQRGLHVRALASMLANGVSNFDYYFMEGTNQTAEPWRALATEASGFTALTAQGEGFKKAAAWLKGTKLTSAYQMASLPVVIRHPHGDVEPHHHAATDVARVDDE